MKFLNEDWLASFIRHTLKTGTYVELYCEDTGLLEIISWRIQMLFNDARDALYCGQSGPCGHRFSHVENVLNWPTMVITINREGVLKTLTAGPWVGVLQGNPVSTQIDDRLLSMQPKDALAVIQKLVRQCGV